jgi:hypothetical protein
MATITSKIQVCWNKDLSLESPDSPLPEAIASGKEPPLHHRRYPQEGHNNIQSRSIFSTRLLLLSAMYNVPVFG